MPRRRRGSTRISSRTRPAICRAAEQVVSGFSTSTGRAHHHVGEPRRAPHRQVPYDTPAMVRGGVPALQRVPPGQWPPGITHQATHFRRARRAGRAPGRVRARGAQGERGGGRADRLRFAVGANDVLARGGDAGARGVGGCDPVEHGEARGVGAADVLRRGEVAVVLALAVGRAVDRDRGDERGACELRRAVLLADTAVRLARVERRATGGECRALRAGDAELRGGVAAEGPDARARRRRSRWSGRRRACRSRRRTRRSSRTTRTRAGRRSPCRCRRSRRSPSVHPAAACRRRPPGKRPRAARSRARSSPGRGRGAADVAPVDSRS